MTAFNHHRLAAALMATTALISAPACAQSALDKTREFSVQAGSLEDVLLAVADQICGQGVRLADLEDAVAEPVQGPATVLRQA